MDELDVIGRLRAVSSGPIDERLMAAHLERASAPRGRSLRSGRVAVIAAAAVLAIPGVALALSAGSHDEDPAVVFSPGQDDSETQELTCTGPPPFAGTEPDGTSDEEREAVRAAEAEAHERWRAENCAVDEDVEDVEDVEEPEGAEVDDNSPGPAVGTACSGPSPFAGVPAEPADPAADIVPSPRAQEAQELAATREACAGGETDGAAEEGINEEDTGGPPEGTPGGPPEGTPGGPPDGVPGGEDSETDG